MDKKVIVMGAIGNTDRQNRDNMRVLNRGGVASHLKHISHRINRW